MIMIRNLSSVFGSIGYQVLLTGFLGHILYKKLKPNNMKNQNQGIQETFLIQKLLRNDSYHFNSL